MADQTQRLEIATVRAEVGSNILFRFSNDSREMTPIPTDSGDIKNLKQVVWDIQEDAADKISIATTIYPTAAAGLAATPDQSIFLVQSNDADEIYTVWKNESGTAVNTGKTALSATAIQTALDASNEAAQAAEDAADVAITRTARYLAPSATPPEVRDDGLSLEVGDVWFNTVDQTEYRYTDAGWRANESQQAIAELEAGISETPGSQRIPRANDDGVLTEGWIPPVLRDNLSRVAGVVDGDFLANVSLYNRSKIIEVGFRDAHYDHLIATRGYSYLYPQQLAIDDAAGELFVLRGPGGGDNLAWIWVYDIATGAVKTVFTTGERWYESLVIRSVGGVRYLYTVGNGGVPIRLDVTTLPALYDTSSPETRYTAVLANSMIAFDGDYWYVQDGAGYLGQVRRNRFLVYDKDFSAIRGRVTFALDVVGTINTSYLEQFPKLQGVCCHAGAIYMGLGAAYAISDTSAASNPSALAGVTVALPTGEKVSSSLAHPDEFIGRMSQLTGYVNTLSENEGICSTADGVCTMWITLGPLERISNDWAGKGIVICLEESKRKDRVYFGSRANSTSKPFNLDRFCATNHTSSSQLTNPLTGAALDTFKQIVQMMQDLGLHRYAFYAVNQTITDVNGSAISTGSKFIEFVNAGGSTYFVTSTGFDNAQARWIVGGTGDNQSGPYFSGEEIGANANGWYVKHASGLMECFVVLTPGLACTTANGAVFRNDGSFTWTFPAEFVVGGPTPSVTGNPCYGNRWWGGTTGQPSRSSCNPLVFSSSSDSTSRPFTLEAKGRWRL